MAGEDDALGDHSLGIRVDEGAHRDQFRSCTKSKSRARLENKLISARVQNRGLALRVLRRSKHQAGLFPEHDRSKHTRDARPAMSQIPFKLMDIVGPLTPTPRVFAIHGVAVVPPWAHAEDQGILRSHRAVVFRISLDGKVEYGVFVLVLEEGEEDEGCGWCAAGKDGTRDVLETDDDGCAGL